MHAGHPHSRQKNDGESEQKLMIDRSNSLLATPKTQTNVNGANQTRAIVIADGVTAHVVTARGE